MNINSSLPEIRDLRLGNRQILRGRLMEHSLMEIEN